MEHSNFLNRFSNSTQHAAFCEFIASDTAKNIHLKGLNGSSAAMAFAAAFKQNQSVFVVLNDREEAAYFFDDISLFNNQEHVLFFPSSFKRQTKYGKISQENILQRTEVLNRINQQRKCIVISYPEALTEKVVPVNILKNNTFQINIGDKLSIEFINDV
ncbi:MAG TPA: hypothetical protein PLF35_15470, partial [Prolixibacteraceae bacterium]|nr:hypothetical protein [Prolixibacteraceae bacterium]